MAQEETVSRLLYNTMTFQITMEDIHNSVSPRLEGVTNGNTSAVSGLGDKRLGLFGYTIESINMLLLPMIQNK